MTPEKILEILILYAENSGHDFQVYSEYAEPGYTDPECGIIALGDWNPKSWGRPILKSNLTMPRIAAILKKLGAEIEWYDEWTTCEGCYRLVRTRPNSYSWTPSYWQSECTILCQECVLDDPEDYLESLEGNPRKANTLDLDLESQGYRKTEGEYENGFFRSQNDDSEVIAKSLRKLGIERFIFEIDSTGQFDLYFSVWVHKDEYGKLTEEKLDSEGINVARATQNALIDASQKLGKLKGEGVRVAKCHRDGTATVKLISHRDFIAGKALD